jgi:hypothetical protein
MKASLALSAAAASLLLAGCKPKKPTHHSTVGVIDSNLGLTGQDVAPSAGFVYGPNFVGEVKKSVIATDVGTTVVFSGLDGTQPRAIFQSSGGNSPLKIIFETASKIGLQLNTGSSLDSFVIDKKTGLFARTWSGNFDGVYAGASIGACK